MVGRKGTKPKVTETRSGLGARNGSLMLGGGLSAERKLRSWRLRGLNMGSWPRTGSHILPAKR